jgi:antitoxin component YwqK of YwqJK toxin-antitoxin module
MKHLLNLLTCLFLLSPNLALSETIDDLVSRKGLYYKKFTDFPFTGKVTGRVQGYLKNGEWHGPYVSYYESGQPRIKITIVNGKNHGPYVEYLKNGQLLKQFQYKNGKRIPD